MTDNMVERVAQAIYEARMRETLTSGDARPWDVVEAWWQDWYRDQARAAIEAMREPVGLKVDGPMAAVWRAMIQAALAGDREA